jgi:hypothetical protein
VSVFRVRVVVGPADEVPESPVTETPVSFSDELSELVQVG